MFQAIILNNKFQNPLFTYLTCKCFGLTYLQCIPKLHLYTTYAITNFVRSSQVRSLEEKTTNHKVQEFT